MVPGSWRARLLSRSKVAVAFPRSRWRTQLSGLGAVRDTTSHLPQSCWKARIPMAFSPRVRSSPALEDSKRLRATSRRRSGLMPRPESSTAITGYRPLRRSTTLMRSPR